MSGAGETTLIYSVMHLSPLELKSCTGYNFHTVRDNLILFGRDMHQVKQGVACKKDNSFSSYLP